MSDSKLAFLQIIGAFAFVAATMIGCSFSVFPKQDNAPITEAPITTPITSSIPASRCTDNAVSILNSAQKIDVWGDVQPKCPLPYELCFDHENAAKLRAKLKLLTGNADSPQIQR